jgi:hypothetical protein
MAREAVDGVYPLCGLTAADPRTALNRAWRDLNTATQDAVLAWGLTALRTRWSWRHGAAMDK